jgi:hypothetical protein
MQDGEGGQPIYEDQRNHEQPNYEDQRGNEQLGVQPDSS